MAEPRTALVTGANKGIGLAIAQQLGQQGHRIWLGCRDAARGEQAATGLRADGIDAQTLQIDVADDASVYAAAEQLGREIEALDVLVNNAGIALGDPAARASEETAEAMRAMFETNAIGPFRVTKAMLPLLRRAKRAHVVMMSSGLGSLAETSDSTSTIWEVGATGYSASKAALNMLTIKLAKDLRAEGIRVNAADPGYTATDLNGNSGHRNVDDAARIAVELATLGGLAPTGGFFHDGYALSKSWRW